MFTTEMLKQYLAGLLRTVAAPVIVYLTAKGYLTDEQVTQQLVIVVSVVITLISSFWNKVTSNNKVETALKLPQNSSRSALEGILKGGGV
jgi:hypothetical protein